MSREYDITDQGDSEAYKAVIESVPADHGITVEGPVTAITITVTPPAPPTS